MSLAEGHILEDRYRVDALLGQGGMGAVYRATYLRFNSTVAIKENQLSTPQAQKQFAREAGLLHQLRHPNLPQVSDHFSVPGQGPRAKEMQGTEANTCELGPHRVD